MTDNLWNDMRYFSKTEKWGNPDRMDSKLIYQLDYLRDYIKRPVVAAWVVKPSANPEDIQNLIGVKR